MNLRAFTREGTLSAAGAYLSDIASLGVDFVYLCPIALSDDDMNRDYWSERQCASGFNNPQNPYRVKDYFKVDPEYGTDDELRDFVKKAHRLGMGVMLDLVYYHCGPTAKFVTDYPDFVVRKADGTPDLGEWCFPRINFDNSRVRETLWDNMEYWVREFDVDGYRCDVGDEVPGDFWCEGIKRVRALKPDFLMLNEGLRADFVKTVGFDLNYDIVCVGLQDVAKGKLTSKELRAVYEERTAGFGSGGRSVHMIENHDTANNYYDERPEKSQPRMVYDALCVVDAMLDGVMFLYNGIEYCDGNRHSIFYNRFYDVGLDCTIDRSKFKDGALRRELLRTLIKLRKSEPALSDGKAEFFDTTDGVISFLRSSETQTLMICVNVRAEKSEFSLPYGIKSVKYGERYQLGEALALDGYGYIVAEV